MGDVVMMDVFLDHFGSFGISIHILKYFLLRGQIELHGLV